MPRSLELSPIWIVGGILLGAVIHIFSVLFVPVVAEHDAWARLAGVGPINTVRPLPPEAVRNGLLPDLDPSMRHAVCRYNLQAGPLRIQAPVPQVYWSVALYDRHGVNYYALNDRLIAEPSIELWVATQDQLLRLGGTGEGVTSSPQDGRLVIGAPEEEGFALFRTLEAQPSFAGMVQQALDGIACSVVAEGG